MENETNHINNNLETELNQNIEEINRQNHSATPPPPPEISFYKGYRA